MGHWQCDSSTSQDPTQLCCQEPGGSQISQQDAEFESSGLSSDRLMLSYKHQIRETLNTHLLTKLGPT